MAEVKHPIPEDLAIRYEKASRVVSAQAEERVDFSGKLLAAAIYNWAASDKELIERIAALDAVRKELQRALERHDTYCETGLEQDMNLFLFLKEKALAHARELDK